MLVRQKSSKPIRRERVEIRSWDDYVARYRPVDRSPEVSFREDAATLGVRLAKESLAHLRIGARPAHRTKVSGS